MGWRDQLIKKVTGAVLGSSKKPAYLQSKVINSAKTNVPKTPRQKMKRDLDLAKQKDKGDTQRTDMLIDKINKQTERLNKDSKKFLKKASGK